MKDQAGFDGGLVLHEVKDDSDARRFARFSAEFNNPGEGATCDCLLKHFPGSSHSNYWFIQDESVGRIAATSCLIPWNLSFAGVKLRVAMLEMVLSHPDYRRQGLVRKLINRFHDEAAAGRYDLAIITGIPYYYRQFGYAYCLDLDGGVRLEGSALSRLQRSGGAYSIRRAVAEDIPALARLYDDEMVHQQIHVIRRAENWRYLMEYAGFNVQAVMHENRISGYAVISGNNRRLHVLESSLTAEASQTVLGLLGTGVSQELVIGGPQGSALARAAMALSGSSEPGGQWLIKLQDPAAFLLKLAPAFECRLSESALKGFSGTVTINFFKYALVMGFIDGKLVSSENTGFIDSSMGADGGDLCIPPDAFVRLLFGWRTVEQLIDAWPDIVARRGSRQIIDILFPQMTSWLNTPYHFQGNPEKMKNSIL